MKLNLLASLLRVCSARSLAGTRDLEIALLDLVGEVIETTGLLESAPGGNATVEHLVHLFEGVSLRFGGSKEHVDKCGGVEGSELDDTSLGKVREREWGRDLRSCTSSS